MVLAQSVAKAQYETLRSALAKAMQRSGWLVNQRSFVAGARSLNEEELKENLEFFDLPSALKENLEYVNVPSCSLREHGTNPNDITPLDTFRSSVTRIVVSSRHVFF